MSWSFRIGKIFGIPIEIHITFILIIPILTWIIGTQANEVLNLLNFPYLSPFDSSLLTTSFYPYLLGFLISMGLFLGVFVHELAHSIIALRNGVKIKSITLLLFGGVATIDEENVLPEVELPMAFIGPFVSLLFGIFCFFCAFLAKQFILSPPAEGFFVFLFGYLGLLNLMLCGFNLIPAFPMDGGRVLRAYLARRMPLYKATKIASDIGRVFAIIFGLISIFTFNPILLIIAFFIYMGANEEYSRDKIASLLQGVRIGDVMSAEVMTVSPGLSIPELLNLMLITKHLGFPVKETGSIVGMVTLSDIQKVDHIDREAMQVKDIMTRDIVTLSKDTEIMKAYRLMVERQIGRIPIMEEDSLIGIVTKTDILKIIEIREV